MRKILVGVTAKTHARPVLDWVLGHASETGADVQLLHVVSVHGLWVITGVQLDAEDYVEDLRDELERSLLEPFRHCGIHVTLDFEVGDPAQTLAAVARRTGAEMIVVGASRHGALHDALLGSTVSKLEHRASVPIVVVPTASMRTRADVRGALTREPS